MASKTFMAVLGVLLATILLVSSEVAAGEVAKQQENKVNDASVVDQKYDRYDLGDGRGGGDGLRGGGGGKMVVPNPSAIVCRYKCCVRARIHGVFRCVHCCINADEMPDVQYMSESHN